MNRAELIKIFRAAPLREFENGKQVRGYFHNEIVAAGIPKSKVKRLVAQTILIKAHVHLKDGTQTFYTLESLKDEPKSENLFTCDECNGTQFVEKINAFVCKGCRKSFDKSMFQKGD